MCDVLGGRRVCVCMCVCVGGAGMPEWRVCMAGVDGECERRCDRRRGHAHLALLALLEQGEARGMS